MDIPKPTYTFSTKAYAIVGAGADYGPTNLKKYFKFANDIKYN